MSFNTKSIDELHDLLVKKEISATELTKSTLEDIKKRETAVDSFITISEEAALARQKRLMKRALTLIMSCLVFL